MTLDMLYIIVDMSAWCRLSVDLDVHQRIPSWSWQYDALRLSSKEVLEVGVAASMFRGVVAWPSRIAMAIMAISTISPWTSILLRLAQGFQWQRKHQSSDALQNKKLECVLTKVTVVPPPMEGVEGPALFGFQVICCHDSVLLVLLGLSSTFPPVLTANEVWRLRQNQPLRSRQPRHHGEGIVCWKP